MARVTTNPVKVAMDLAPGILLKSVEHAEGVCEELAKAHYIKRIATGNAERPWSYVYDTPDGKAPPGAKVKPRPKRPRAKRIPGGKSPSPAHTAAWGKLGEALKQGPGALAAMSVAAFVMVREYMKGIYGAAGAEIGLKRLEEMGAKNARLAREDAAAKREAEAAPKKTAPAAGAAKKPKDTNAQDLASKQARKTK